VIQLLVWIIVIGVVAYVLNLVVNAMPMNATFKRVANALVIAIAILMLLNVVVTFFGLSLWPDAPLRPHHR